MVPSSWKWREWGQPAFEESEASGQPLFLLINDFWSEASASAPSLLAGDRDVSALLRKAFVPVLVDADRHPDVRRRYGSGPMPCGAVLHADGNVVACFPDTGPQELYSSLRAITQCTAGHRPKKAPGLGAYQVPFIPSDERDLERGPELVESIRDRLVAVLDVETGDLGGGAGSASLAPLRFLLTYATYLRDRRTLDVVVKSLHALGHSDLYDAVEGGFFHGRDKDGLHTEKLLPENAEWAALAMDVAQESGATFALPLASGILHYLQSHLLQADGAMGAGQREDRSFYLLSLEERRLVTHPPVCNAGLTTASAAAVSALCKAWRRLGEPAYLDMALDAWGFLKENMIAPDGATAHAFGDAPEGLGLLEDQVELGFAMMDLYHATLDPKYLEGVRGAVTQLLTSFLNPAGNGFLDVRIRPDGEGIPYQPLVDPGLNARTAEFLALASAQFEDESVAAPARKILAALMRSPLQDPSFMGLLGCALLRILHPVPFFLAETDGSQGQSTRVLRGVRDSGEPFSMILHRVSEPAESPHALPRLVAHCGRQQKVCAVP